MQANVIEPISQAWCVTVISVYYGKLHMALPGGRESQSALCCSAGTSCRHPPVRERTLPSAITEMRNLSRVR